MTENKHQKVWCTSDEIKLLDLWAERAGDLRRTRRNLHMYADISIEMSAKFKPKEVHIKIGNFTQRYREERKKVEPSGGSPSEWKHYDAVHKIIGSTAVNNAEVFESFIVDISSSVLPPSQVASSSELPMPQHSEPCQTLPPLSSPILPLSSSPSLAPLDTSFTSIATSGSTRKRNNMGELIKVTKQQNELLKTVVENGKELSKKVFNAIEEQSSATKEFINIMKNILAEM